VLTALVVRHRGVRRAAVYSRNRARAQRAAALGRDTVSIDEVALTPATSARNSRPP